VEFLRVHQCDEAQGYLFSRPVPPRQFARLLEAGISDAVLAPRGANSETVKRKKAGGRGGAAVLAIE
jgi:hypothetical protein